MSIWVLRGLRDGVVTTRWPRQADEYADTWRGPVAVRAGAAAPPGAAARCPTGAIQVADRVRVDQGKCILCGRCVAERPDAFAWSIGATGPGTAALARQALVVPGRPGDRRDDCRRAYRPGRTHGRAAAQHPRPARGRGIGRQRGMGDPGAARPHLRRRPARHLLHRQPAPRRRAARHRRRNGRDDRTAAHHLRGNAGPESGDRRRHRCRQRRHARRPAHRDVRHSAGGHLAAGQSAVPVRHLECSSCRGRESCA